MLIGDLDIKRAESDPAYLTRVLQFLLSTPRRLRAGLPGKARKPHHTSERIEPTLSVAAMTAQSEPSNNVVALASPRALR